MPFIANLSSLDEYEEKIRLSTKDDEDFYATSFNAQQHAQQLGAAAAEQVLGGHDNETAVGSDDDADKATCSLQTPFLLPAMPKKEPGSSAKKKKRPVQRQAL